MSVECVSTNLGLALPWLVGLSAAADIQGVMAELFMFFRLQAECLCMECEVLLAGLPFVQVCCMDSMVCSLRTGASSLFEMREVRRLLHRMVWTF